MLFGSSHKLVNALAVGMLCLSMAACRPIAEQVNSPNAEPLSTANTASSIDLALGNPSNASTADRNNFLIIRRAYALSYNNSKGILNWIEWKTTGSDLGDKLDRPDFHPDARLPDGFRRINTFDYNGSGYDRGHMCPSADRFGDAEANEETFAMTNIVPQTGDLNQFPWEKLESYSRSIARRGFDVYTIAGVYGDAGTIKGKIMVPTNCWKIILSVRPGRQLTDPASRRTNYSG